MLDQYNILKNKLEVAQINNAKLSEEIRKNNKGLEEYKQEKIIALKTMKDLSAQISILLYFIEKMKKQIHDLNPYFDMSIYSDYKHALKSLQIDDKEHLFYTNISELQLKNQTLLLELHRKSPTSEIPHDTLVELEELKRKIKITQEQNAEKETIIANLTEELKKRQTLKDVTQILSKQASEIGFLIEKNDTNKSALEKNNKFYDHHSKILEENSVLRKELKRLRIDMKKLGFSHENLNSLAQGYQEQIQQYITSLNSKKEVISNKEAEIMKILREKNSISENLMQKNNEIDQWKIKVMEVEKKAFFFEETKKKLEELLKTALVEKMKYFDSFLSLQKDFSTQVIRHKNELLDQRKAFHNFQKEKNKEIERFITQQNDYQMRILKFKTKIENQDVLLMQLNKRNQLNSQIIAEQNEQILQLTKKINIPMNPLAFEEGLISGFVHISQQKNFSLDEFKETLEKQKNSYESLIEKMTQNLVAMEQENVLFQENIKNLEFSNEELQEKLNQTLLKIQEIQNEKESPQFSSEEMDILNEEIENLKRENEVLKVKYESVVHEKEEIQRDCNENIEKIKALTEENTNVYLELNSIKGKLQLQTNLVGLKDILLKEQYDLFQGQMKEITHLLNEKANENHTLLEKLTEKKEVSSQMEIEETIPSSKLNESDVILDLKQKNIHLEMKLQEKIKEEFLLKKQTNLFKKQIEFQTGETIIEEKENEVNKFNELFNNIRKICLFL